MTDLVGVLGGLSAGMAAGVVFFGGLSATVARISQARRPAVLMLLSTFLRLAFVIVTVTLVALAWDWPAVLAALIGLLVVRGALVRRARHAARDTA
ncbi:MAG TPA: ATP synthase subunit I [Acidimicrobiia bacterium]|nr:ATP synthase subunit I [Acidimicrobiia bacterium]